MNNPIHRGEEVAEVYQAQLATAWQEITGEEPPEDFLREYYPRIDRYEFEALGAKAMAGCAWDHLRTARRFTGTAPVVSLHNPEPGDADYTGNHTRIAIVVTDVRYLVSSVTAALSSTGYVIRRVHHPTLITLRDSASPEQFTVARKGLLHTDTQALPTLAEVDSPEARIPRRESWLLIDIDRIAPESFDGLAGALEHIIAVIRAAAADEAAMAERAHTLAADLRERAPRPELAAEAIESADFLDWIDGRFAFMGYREYRLVEAGGSTRLEPVEGTALGISALRDTTVSPLSKSVSSHARDPHVLVLTKANSRSQIIRRGFMDYLGVKVFDEAGEIVGERRFVGLYTAPMYNASVLDVPVLRAKVSWIMQHSGLLRDSHSGTELLGALESFPRDDMLQAEPQDVLDIVLTVIDLQEKRESSVFIRRDTYERYVSVLVYVPRDLYDTASRLRVEAVLRDLYRADSVDFDVLLSDSILARLHFVARVGRDEMLPDISPEVVAERIKSAVRSWSEDLEELLAPSDEKLSQAASERARLWAHAFPADYREHQTPEQALADVDRFDTLVTDLAPRVMLHREPGTDEHHLRLALYRLAPAGLSAIVPHLSNLGAQILDERPYRIDLADGTQRYIYDFGLEFSRPVDREDFARIESAFAAGWRGLRETSSLDSLIIAGLSWTELTVLQALGAYLRQAGLALRERTMAGIFTAHPELAGLLVTLFTRRFDPAIDSAERERLVAEAEERIEASLAQVATLDADRLVRAMRMLIRALVRTNAFTAGPDTLPQTLAFKLHPTELSFAPKPRPAIEVWVYSPEVEGVHLRFGKVARGGLRWSDRPDDFRTEILGLVKAQMVKNALIVPTGAKGGFVPKHLPDPTVDRSAWAAAGQHAYEKFIGALLDLTDNLVQGPTGQTVEYPDSVVRYDGDDTYLVVAADKGTARFSDIANGLAISRGFWLGDAFASGGSVGYDHKAMGITSRGAWKSVERHFRELGVDTSREDFTAVGIGDMSGDVFGNGMLRSRHTRLIAAFDHRDIFIDPDPEPLAAFDERKRLFELPRSSWQDYDKSLLSAGGGVYSRTAKSVLLSTEAAAALGLAPGRYTPGELISGILKAPVDLLYNGGIGTYIKATGESDAAVGDKANEDIRVTGAQLRARVVGEGGNLGATQLGRIEAALHGVRINTDAVDNSAGVDTSDHEVNIKLLIDGLIRAGKYRPEQREALLLDQTGEVADLVLANNYSQNAVLGEGRDEARTMTGALIRLQRFLEEHAGLDSAVEFLPDAKTMSRRRESGGGYVSPELAVLLAYVKMHAASSLLESTVPDESFMAGDLAAYFPSGLDVDAADLAGHPLRREIATAHLVNRMVDRSGLTYIFRIIEETGAKIPQIARTFAAVSEIFDLDEHFDTISALDNIVPSQVQIKLVHEYVRLLDRASRWLLNLSPEAIDVPAQIARLQPVVRSLRPQLQGMLRGADRAAVEEQAAAYIAAGVPADLAWRTGSLLDEFALLDVATVAERTGLEARDVAEVYYGVTDLLRGQDLLVSIGALDRSSRWSALARGALRDDFYQAVHSIALVVLGTTTSANPTPEERADERIAQWQVENQTALDAVRSTTDEVLGLEQAGQAPLSVLLRMMRSLVRSTRFNSGAGE
nr:NAD-glutamate dehydrogenase [Brevibacterium sp. 50QC2O2]